MDRRHLEPLIGWRGLLAAAALLLLPLAVRAGALSFPQDTDVPLTGSGITLRILAGSTAESMLVDSASVTIQVKSGDTLTLRYPGPNPGTLVNDGNLKDCDNTTGNNDAVLVGPKTVAFFPTTTVCPMVVATSTAATTSSGGGGGDTSRAPDSVALGTPNGGENLTVGSEFLVLWTANGSSARSVRFSLSLDGGATYDAPFATVASTSGVYRWIVSAATGTAAARLKIETLNSTGGLIVSDVSDAGFTIKLPAPLPGGLIPAATISADKELLPPVAAPCVAGAIVKTAKNAAVYYCGGDGRRYVFPNEKVYFSWYKDFSSVMTIDPVKMAGISLGGNVTYKPGSRLLKIQSDPKVYAVSKGGVLRWVASESVAAALYGASWRLFVDDVSDAIFANYRLGAPIVSP